MGSYLYVGIVTEVGFSGKIGSSLEPVLLEKVKESLSNDMNLPLQKYHLEITEDKKAIFKIPESLFEENMIPFLETHLKMFNPPQSCWPFLEGLKSMKTYPEMMAYFHQRKQESDPISPVDHGTFFTNTPGIHSMISFKAIAYVYNGKFMAEAWTDVFTYFESLIRSQKENHVLADYVKVFIQ